VQGMSTEEKEEFKDQQINEDQNDSNKSEQQQLNNSDNRSSDS